MQKWIERSEIYSIKQMSSVSLSAEHIAFDTVTRRKYQISAGT